MYRINKFNICDIKLKFMYISYIYVYVLVKKYIVVC